MSLAVALAVGSTIVTAIGNSAQARANRDAANAQALLNEAKADERLRQVKRESNVFKRQSEVMMGDMVSSYAKAGVELSSSPLLVLANSARELETERAELVRRGTMEAKLFRMGAANARLAADKAGDTLATQQIATVLGGAASIIDKAT